MKKPLLLDEARKGGEDPVASTKNSLPIVFGLSWIRASQLSPQVEGTLRATSSNSDALRNILTEGRLEFAHDRLREKKQMGFTMKQVTETRNKPMSTLNYRLQRVCKVEPWAYLNEVLQRSIRCPRRRSLGLRRRLGRGIELD
ncbi:MAG: hypothetical protein DWQ01_11020 [Planctomycetota bacterium]|nr:MAG: hypothetical protein DWQ01_11020 [Planctomycetota bacterium]